MPLSNVAQKGSSGGAITDSNNQLIGIVSTSMDDSSTGGRSLDAISTSYINRSLQANINESLNDIVTGAGAIFKTDFENGPGIPLAQELIKANPGHY